MSKAKQEINADGERVLCQTENYADSYGGLGELLRGDSLLGLLAQLAWEPMLLFEEEIGSPASSQEAVSPMRGIILRIPVSKLTRSGKVASLPISMPRPTRMSKT